MTDQATLAALRALPLFETLTDPQVDRVASLGRVLITPAGVALVRQGERADNVYIVLSGTARVEIEGAEVGEPIGRGECIGELAVLDDAPRAATVVSNSAVELLAFTSEAFREVLAETPELRESVTRALTRRLRQVSSGWAQLAVDTDVLLDAFYALQGPGDRDRQGAIQQAAQLLRRLAHSASDRPPVALDLLSPAERRVADLVARGLSNALVAAELTLSEHTVASHLKHIYVKLGVPSRVVLAGAVLRSA